MKLQAATLVITGEADGMSKAMWESLEVQSAVQILTYIVNRKDGDFGVLTCTVNPLFLSHPYSCSSSTRYRTRENFLLSIEKSITNR